MKLDITRLLEHLEPLHPMVVICSPEELGLESLKCAGFGWAYRQ